VRRRGSGLWRCSRHFCSPLGDHRLTKILVAVGVRPLPDTITEASLHNVRPVYNDDRPARRSVLLAALRRASLYGATAASLSRMLLWGGAAAAADQ